MISKYPRQLKPLSDEELKQQLKESQNKQEETKSEEVYKDLSKVLCSQVKEGSWERNEKEEQCEVKCTKPNAKFDRTTNSCICPYWITTDGKNECIYNAYGTMGIQCSPEQMKTGSCSRNINQTLGLDKSRPNPTVFVQDLILAATSFVGTVMVIALIIMWWKYIQGGFDESSSGDLKKNIMKLLIGLGLIVGSYTIIRVIQYIAMGM